MQRLHAGFFRLHHHGTQRRLQLLLPGSLKRVQFLLNLRLEVISGRLPLGLVQGTQRRRGGRRTAVVAGVRRRALARLVTALVLLF